MKYTTPMRDPEPGEGFFVRYGLRPLIWLVYQFTPEARLLCRISRTAQRGSR